MTLLHIFVAFCWRVQNQSCLEFGSQTLPRRRMYPVVADFIVERLPVPSSSLDLQVFELTPTCHVQRSIPIDQYTQDQIQLGDTSQVLDSLRTLDKVILAEIAIFRAKHLPQA